MVKLYVGGACGKPGFKTPPTLDLEVRGYGLARRVVSLDRQRSKNTKRQTDLNGDKDKEVKKRIKEEIIIYLNTLPNVSVSKQTFFIVLKQRVLTTTGS